jgi:hypothetical protein
MDGSQVQLVVRPFRDGDEHRWDNFVLRRANGTFFHLAGWKRVIERAFGHHTYYLLSERDGAISGVLPLTLVKSPAIWVFADLKRICSPRRTSRRRSGEPACA